MIVLIDNYDSFTFNLWQALAVCGEPLEVVRNDRATVDEVLSRRPTGIVLSPGPRSPSEAGICVDLVTAASGKIPLLGVCLGHQAIGQAFGAKVVRASTPMHGRQSLVRLATDELFVGLTSPMAVGRYHSLVVDPDSLPKELEAIGDCLEADGKRTLMAIRHRAHPTWGVQFHPESVLSPDGIVIIRNFVEISQRRARGASGGNESD